MNKKNKQKSNYGRFEDDVYEDRSRSRATKAIRQNKTARNIERALKRKDYKALAEDYM